MLNLSFVTVVLCRYKFCQCRTKDCGGLGQPLALGPAFCLDFNQANAREKKTLHEADSFSNAGATLRLNAVNLRITNS